jgi:hypothetical protein
MKQGRLMEFRAGFRKLFQTFALSVAVASNAISPEAEAANEFRMVSLSTGISLEVPSHWYVLTLDQRQNILASGAALISNASIPKTAEKFTLLAVNAVPAPAGATIRVSFTTKPEFTADALRSATSTELEALRAHFIDTAILVERAGGPHVISVSTPNVINLAGHPSIQFSYVRKDVSDPSVVWQVIQFQTPLPDRLVQFTVAWRKTDEILWRPIIDRVVNSFRFEG